jgi:hypothetical protein
MIEMRRRRRRRGEREREREREREKSRGGGEIAAPHKAAGREETMTPIPTGPQAGILGVTLLYGK